MLRIDIPAGETFNNETNEFIECKGCSIALEHSLVSISKWESKWHKPFLTKEQKTSEEMLDYIKCMTLTQNVDPNVYLVLSKDNIEKIQAYMDDPMSATWFSEHSANKNGEVVTSELIYYWMISLQIPIEFQKWHLNRLMTLIRVCDVKNQPTKKMKPNDVLRQNAKLNAARHKKARKH